MDDILVFGQNVAKHDVRLVALLKRIKETGVTLNADNCEFVKSEVKFLGHVIDKEGIRADSDKTSAIVKLNAPTNVTELHRFL